MGFQQNDPDNLASNQTHSQVGLRTHLITCCGPRDSVIASQGDLKKSLDCLLGLISCNWAESVADLRGGGCGGCTPPPHPLAGRKCACEHLQIQNFLWECPRNPPLPSNLDPGLRIHGRQTCHPRRSHDRARSVTFKLAAPIYRDPPLC